MEKKMKKNVFTTALQHPIKIYSIVLSSCLTFHFQRFNELTLLKYFINVLKIFKLGESFTDI